MSEPKTMQINDVEYVRKDSIKSECVEFTGEESIATRMIGKKVICRSRNDGINAGIVVLADETGVELKSCRRLWGFRPKDTKMSWYEGVCKSGISTDSKVSDTVDQKIIIEDYSLTICEDEAFTTIMELKPNEQ